MNRFILADPHTCIGCHTCEAACAHVHAQVGLVAYPRLTVTYSDNVTMPLQCRQCDDAPCEKVCPVKAIVYADRAVQLNESTCIGCKMCGLACPFGAITPSGTLPHAAQSTVYGATPVPVEPLPLHPILNWTIGQRTVAVKCDLCHFLPQGPECIRVCPTKALHLVDEDVLAASEQEKRLAATTRFAGSNPGLPSQGSL